MRLTGGLEGHCLIWWLFKSYPHLVSWGGGVVITQFVICVIPEVFILIWNQDYIVLGNEHGVMEQKWLLWPYKTILNNKLDLPFQWLPFHPQDTSPEVLLLQLRMIKST